MLLGIREAEQVESIACGGGSGGSTSERDNNEEDSEDDDGVDVITLDDDDDENENEVIKSDGGSGSRASSSESSDISESESDDEEANDGGSSGSPIKKSKPVVEEEETEDSNSDSDSDAYNDDDEVDVITLDDDDENEKKLEEALSSKPMICYRCPVVANKPLLFSDRVMYLFHVQRHRLGENFACPTCKRPFTKLNICMAHEIMVHGTEIPSNCYSNNDPLISAAKEFVGKSISSVEPSTSQGNNDNAHAHSSSGTLKTDNNALPGGNDNDDEIDINNGHIVTSTSFLAYRGPPVTHILECYEIQLNHCRRKDARANHIAKIAIDVHKQNVDQGFDEYRLGRFAKRKTRAKKLPGQLGSGELSTTSSTTTTTITTEESSDVEGMKEPQKKRARTLETCRTSCSSTGSSSPIPNAIPPAPPPPAFAEIKDSDDSSDLFIPRGSDSSDRKRKREVEGTTPTTSSWSCSTTSSSPILHAIPPPRTVFPDSDDDSSDLFIPRTSHRKRKRGDEGSERTTPTTSQSPRRSCLSALLQRVCRQCDYTWTTAEDLHKHREIMHPNVKLLDLLHFPVADSSLKSKKSSSPVKKVTFADVTRGSPRKQNEGRGVGRNVAIKSSSKAMGNGRKLRNILYRTPVPFPNSSFTEKERFLFDLGLSNVFRLHLHLKKPLEELNMPQTSVIVEKMNQLDFGYYFAKYQQQTSQLDSEMLTGFHFLLGFL